MVFILYLKLPIGLKVKLTGGKYRRSYHESLYSYLQESKESIVLKKMLFFSRIWNVFFNQILFIIYDQLYLGYR